MSNPFMVLDLSDDENITVVKPVAAEAKPEKKHHVPPRGDAVKPHQPRKELLKEEEDLKQKKKGPPGARGAQPQPDVAHPGERSKIGLKKEEHVNTHKPSADGEARRGRQFDRHSGTGRGREMKKAGGGGHNWGKAGEETPAPAATPEATGTEAPKEEEAPVVVEEDPSLTLEEYEKLRAQKRSGEAFETKQVRKVTTEVTGTIYKKDEDVGEGDYIKLGSDEQDLKKKPGHFKNKTKQVFEIDFKVRETPQEPPRRGRPEGGPSRSAPRPEGSSRPSRGTGAPRGRGGPAGGRSAAGVSRGAPGAAGRIDTADQSAFPKLGGSA